MFAEMQLALYSVTVPLLVVFLACGAAIWFRLPLLSSAGLALAVMIPCLLAYGPTFPPSRLLDYLPILGLAAFLLFLPLDLKVFPGILPDGMRWLFSLLVVWLLLRPKIALWSFQETAANVSVVVLIWATIWSYLEAVSKTRRGGMLILTIAAFGGGIVLYFGGSIVLGRMGVALAVALASWLFLARISPGMRLGHAALGTVYTLFASLVLIGAYYSQIPRGIILLLIAAFAADLIVQIAAQLKPDMRPVSVTELTAALALVPISIVVWFSVGGYFIGGQP